MEVDNEGDLTFHSSIVNTNEEYGVFVFGMAKDDSFEYYITLQYQPDLTEEEISNGFTPDYIAIGPNNIGEYDLVDKPILGKNKLILVLNDKGRKLFNYEKLVVHFESKKYYELVHDSLVRIYQNRLQLLDSF